MINRNLKFLRLLKISKKEYLSIILGGLVSMSHLNLYLSLTVLIIKIPFFIFLNNEIKLNKNNIDSIDNRYRLEKYIGFYFFGYHIFLMSWILNLNNFFGISLLVPILIICVTFIGLIMGIMSYWVFRLLNIFKYLYNYSPYFRILKLTSAFVVFEITPILLGEFSYSWGRFGNGLAPITPLIQIASITGVAGISFLAILVNLLVTESIQSKKYKYLIYGLLIVCIWYYSGNFKINDKVEYSNKEPINILLLQSGEGNLNKWGNDLNHIINIYTEIIDNVMEEGEEVDLIVFPETAIPANLDWYVYDSIVERYNTEFLIGGFLFADSSNNEYYNILLNPKNQEYYTKQLLVPFAEFSPIRLPFFSQFSNGVVNYKNEDGVVKFNFDNLDDEYILGCIICYDSTSSAIVRKAVKNNGEILVVATNDSWFDGTSALYQHHNFSILRSVENNRYTVRSANTGITSIIDNKGRIIDSLGDYNGSSGLVVCAYPINEKTFYTLYGEWFTIILFIGLVVDKMKWRNKP